MAFLGSLGPILSLAGTAVSAVGTIAAGQAQARAAETQAEFAAQQQETQAADERATAQRQAQQESRKKRLALSRVQSLSSASGLSATDPSTLDLVGDIEQYGTYRSQIAEYGGESRAAALRDAATASRVSGKAQAAAARTSAFFDAGSTILGGISSMYEKYGRRAGGSAGFRYG